MDNLNPIIRLDNVSKTYHSKAGDVHALKNISLDIHQGEIYGVIGLSGAGKSTLVRCINFLEKPTGGNVIVDGVDLGSLNNAGLNQARHGIGMIFQQFNLLMQKTTVENICFPLEIAKMPKAKAVARAMELLEMVGLSDKAKSYPSQLSGGQKQRVAIARALATNPKILLCDEATSALDPASTRSILELLKDINERLGITIVVITHEMSIIEDICHKVAIIDKSEIAEVGNVKDIFARPQSQIAKKLVFPSSQNTTNMQGKRCCRIIFDGQSSFEPTVANMVLEFKMPVNILYANSKNIDGRAVGQMVLQLPEDEHIAEKMMNYLNSKDITTEEFYTNDNWEVAK